MHSIQKLVLTVEKDYSLKTIWLMTVINFIKIIIVNFFQNGHHKSRLVSDQEFLQFITKEATTNT